MKKHIGTAAAFLATTTFAWADSVAPGEVAFVDGAIEASLTGTPGDPAAGQVVMNKGSGNCIACHMVSQLEDIYPFHGEVGPPLDGAADRWTEAELRGIVTNAKMMFEGSMMPSFYKTTAISGPAMATPARRRRNRSCRS